MGRQAPFSDKGTVQIRDMWTLLEFLDNFKINLRANDQKKDQLGVKRFMGKGVFSGASVGNGGPGGVFSDRNGATPSTVYIVRYRK